MIIMFVSVGIPLLNSEHHILMNKVKTGVQEGESLNKVGKMLRKAVADSPRNHNIVARPNERLAPATLSWAVFMGVEAEIPIVCSKNWGG